MTRILVIEGDPSARLLLQSRLKDQGYEVLLTENGAQGLVEARNGRLDLVLLAADLGSGIGSIEVCRRLKQTPQTCGIPVVVISSRAQTREEVHQAYESGCEHFLAKSEMPLLEDVVRAMLRVKSQHNDLAHQIHAQEDENRRLHEDRQRGADLETSLRESGEHALIVRELSAGHPDGIMVVDDGGVVRYADRGSRDFLGSGLEGRNLGNLAPSSGLEAFVRDARTEAREGFRFDLPSRSSVNGRSLTASVVPLVPNPGERDPGLRIVLLLDAGKRRVAAELLGIQDDGGRKLELGTLLEAAHVTFRPSRILGPSPAAQMLRDSATAAAGHGSAVLIHGEIGTGKTFLARALHYSGERSGPFISVDCAALAPKNVEREIFGYVKGAFPEAMADRPGAIQRARHGTLHLHAIDEIAPETQERILDALRDRRVRRFGSERLEPIDVRVIAEIRRDPDEALSDGRLLAKLFEGVEWSRIHAPPLRERRLDVADMVQAFLERFGGERATLQVESDALGALQNYRWPGNVRELESCIDQACVRATGSSISVEHLEQPLRELAHALSATDVIQPVPPPVAVRKGTHAAMNDTLAESPGGPGFGRTAPFEEPSLEGYEKQCLLDTLKRTGGDKLEAARRLGIGKSTLYRKLNKYKIS